MSILHEFPALPAQEDKLTRHRIADAIFKFILGFALLSAGVHFCIRQPLRLYAQMRSEKIQLLEQWAGRASSASFGSSHVLTGFDPRVFDRELVGGAPRTVSINLGIAGGSQSEQRAMALEFLRQLRRPRGPSSCLVLLELNAGANLGPNFLVHPRSINIYDWQTMKFVLDLSEPSLGLPRQIGRVSFALVASGLHNANVGMLSSTMFSPVLDKALIEAETKNDRRGLYNVEHVSDADRRSLRAVFDRRPAKSLAKSQLLSRGNYELLRQLREKSPLPDIQFIYVVWPKASDLISFPNYPSVIQLPSGVYPIFNLARPDRYPDLYSEDKWHDAAHLNEAGASLATHILVTELKSWQAHCTSLPSCGGHNALR